MGRTTGKTRQDEEAAVAAHMAAQARQKPTALDVGLSSKQGLDRSFAVLDLIAARPCRVVDVMRDIGLPWATAHRTVKKLEKAQFLMLNPETSHYEIGPRMWHLGSSYLANNKMLKAALSYLAKDTAIRGVDIQVVERIGGFSVVIHAEKRQVQEISKAQYGYHIPLHVGSKGLVLLAYETPDFVSDYCASPLEQLTPSTITDPQVLRARLAEVKEQGFARTEGDVQTFTGSMAAPVFGPKGSLAGCICFVYLKTMARDALLMDDLREALLLMSHSVSLELGWHPGQS